MSTGGAIGRQTYNRKGFTGEESNQRFSRHRRGSVGHVVPPHFKCTSKFILASRTLPTTAARENTFISFRYPKAFIYYQAQLPIFNIIDNNTVIMHA
jgi:hypothetical protein